MAESNEERIERLAQELAKSKYNKRDALESEEVRRGRVGKSRHTEYYLDEPAKKPPKK